MTELEKKSEEYSEKTSFEFKIGTGIDEIIETYQKRAFIDGYKQGVAEQKKTDNETLENRGKFIDWMIKNHKEIILEYLEM